MANVFCVYVLFSLCSRLVIAQFGFFPQREDRRNGPLITAHRTITTNLNRLLHVAQDRNSNPEYYVYPFNNRPNHQYNEYGRPYYPHRGYYQNQFPQPQQPPQEPYQPNWNQKDPNRNQPIYVPDREMNIETAKTDEDKTAYANNNSDNTPVFGDRFSEVEIVSQKNDNVNFPTDGPGSIPDFPNIENTTSELPPLTPVPEILPPLTPVLDVLPPLSPAPEVLPPLTPLPEKLPPLTAVLVPEGVTVLSTTLSPLTPVPATETRNNFNFGSQGLFQETCLAFDGKEGHCITINKCEAFLKLVQQDLQSARPILRKAHCGFDGDNPKVCCPVPGLPTVPPTASPTSTTTTTTTSAPAPPAPNAGRDFVSSLPEPPVCGVSNASFSRVVGGVDAKLGDFPWMALLGYKNRRTGSTRWLCGGSLITSKHVLTAAHCINGHEVDLYVVRLGELDLEKEDGASPIDVLIKSKNKHEGYSGNSYVNDIGILVLEQEVQFTDLIRPICIPKDSDLRARSFEGFNPIIAGWGDLEFRGPSATHLQALQLPVVKKDFCKKAYSPYKAQVIDERVLCAGYEKGGKDACQGDSGGPLMQPIWNKEDFSTHFYQIGVVSYGKKCAEAGFPGVYSRVTHFVPWIEAQILGGI